MSGAIVRVRLMLDAMKVTSAVATILLGASLLLNVVGTPMRQFPAAFQPGSGTNRWSWPLAPVPNVVRAFDPPAQRWLSGHRGADLGAGPGTVVLAPAGGIVSFVGAVVDRPVIVIDHGAGLRSSFEPVRSSLKVGALVASGDEIGMVGSGSHCDGLCLHWGLRLLEEYIDPLLTIRDIRPSILLPKQASEQRGSSDRHPPRKPKKPRAIPRDARIAQGCPCRAGGA